MLLFVKDLIGLVSCFRYIIVNYNMIKRLNTIGVLGIVAWSSSLCQNKHFARSTNYFVGRLHIIHQSADRVWTFHGHGMDNTQFAAW